MKVSNNLLLSEAGVSVWWMVLSLMVLLQPSLRLSGQEKAETEEPRIEEPGISEQEFQKLLLEIDTPQDKTWRQIPWKISLLDAQKEAATSRKPIFIWAMDGHPLGCT